MSEQQISKLAGALTEHQDYFSVMSTEDRQWAIQNTKDAITLFAEAVKTRVKVEVKKLLRFREEFSVGPLKKRFVPDEFFKTRKGLYLWNDMQRVLKNASPVESAGAGKLCSFDLTRNAYDRNIKAELPERHEVELWQIAELIEAQKNGEEGRLLTNGYANIFYVAGCAVRVDWPSAYREWRVNGWGLGGLYWRAGRRVFSCN